MLYFYKYLVNHDINKLHEHIEYFFDEMYKSNSNQFNQNILHPEFKPIANKCKKILLKPIKKIFKEFKALDDQEKDTVYNAFKTNNLIERLCKGEDEPIHYDELPEALRGEMKSFFKNLYEKLPTRKSFVEKYGTLKQHFDEFCKLNKHGICPFCGLTDLQSEYDEIRDDYDHYLPKSKYPFNSVNFENLVPTCDKCNKKYKSQVDTLYKGNNKTVRRKVFYPYDESSNQTISVKISPNGTSNDIFNDGFEIDLNGPPSIHEEIESWNDIFKIKKRYKAKIKKKIITWIDRFKNSLKKEQRKSTFDFNVFLTDYLDDLCFAGLDDKGFLKKAVFDFLFSLQEFRDSLIESQ
jgi:hypothetical protein